MDTKNTFPRTHILIEGPEALPFLQALLSQSVLNLMPTEVRYGLLLTSHGRIFSDLFIQSLPQGLLLSTPPSRGEAVLKQLSLFKLRRNLSLSLTSGFISFDLSPFEGSVLDPRIEGLYFSLHLPSPSPTFDYTAWRLEHCLPEGDDFVWEKSIPLEFHLDQLNAIDWRKGCYPGQELTARTHYQGIVRKGLLYGEVLHPCSIGQELFFEDKKIGEIRALHEGHALCQVRLEDLPALPLVLKNMDGIEALKGLVTRS